MRKLFFILIAAGAVTGFLLFYEIGSLTEEAVEQHVQSPATLAKSSPLSLSLSENLPTAATPVTLVAGNREYAANVPKDSSIVEAMNILASTSPFAFSSTYYSGLGYLVESINGVKNSGGTYWTLYINGAYSTVGASQYRLKEGDRIEWRYEKK